MAMFRQLLMCFITAGFLHGTIAEGSFYGGYMRNDLEEDNGKLFVSTLYMNFTLKCGDFILFHLCYNCETK